MGDALLTGAFGVAVALITWILAGLRERQSFRRDMQKEHVAMLQELYAACIEALEMSVRVTISLGSYDEVERQHSKNNALLLLLSTEEINDQHEKVSVLLQQWSSLYRRGAPKPTADPGMFLVRSWDSQYSKNAEEFRPELDEEVISLVRMMAMHLKRERVLS
jgi:hypothetical protein